MTYQTTVRFFYGIMLIFICIPGLISGQAISRIGNSPYPYSSTPDTLFMVNVNAMPQNQQVTVVALQGLLSRAKPQIMVNWGATDFINDLTNYYGVTYDSTYFNDFSGLINHFKTRIVGYILCNSNDSTTSAAISVAAMLNGIVVNSTDTAAMSSIGVPQIYSTIGRGEFWSYDTFQHSYSHKIISLQDPTKSSFLTDYTILGNAYSFYDFPTLARVDSIFAGIQINGAVFGWFGLENDFVSPTSEAGLHVHASDFSSNLSVYSNFSIPQQHQVNHTDDTILRPGVHTVCFVMTDGDNIQWLNGMESVSNWYASPQRGQVNLGWTISPALAEIAPTEMKHYYDSAATTPAGRDGFICAPSGLGYSYPDLFANPDSGAAITSRMMQKADLSIMNVIANSYSQAELAPYLAEPNIDAIFYYTYQNDYFGAHGFTDCINNKPVISGRFDLNQGDYSTYTLAQAINAMPRDPYSDSGYSLIPVNVWSSRVDSVVKCAQMLDSNIRVVTPESFVKLYKAGNNCIPTGITNVGHANGVTVSNAPNPSTDRTEIIYTLPQASRVEAVLYDQSGMVVRTLFTDFSTIGTHSVDVDTHSLSSGMYYYTLHGDYFIITRKLVIIR